MTSTVFVQNDRPNLKFTTTDSMLFSNPWLIDPEQRPESCILCLPGRGQHGTDLSQIWGRACLNKTLIYSVTPKKYCWYPMPINANDQREAVSGLAAARNEIENVLSRITNNYGIPRERIAVCGFSAGGVMANYVGIHSQSPLAGVACFAGAIFEPKKVPSCKFSEVPYLLTHAYDDNNFDWEERYVPMKKALVRNGYQLHAAESNWGGHMVNVSDVLLAAYIFSERLGYTDSWREEYSLFKDYDFGVYQYNLPKK